MKVKSRQGTSYKSVYRVKHKERYKGNTENIVARSTWELATYIWLDSDGHNNIKRWSSEEIVIPYKFDLDGKYHRYFVDLYIEKIDGTKLLVEIKPEKYTRPPKKPKRETKRYKEEVAQWIKNNNKWHAAMQYAKKHGMVFEVWTEGVLRSLGIRIPS